MTGRGDWERWLEYFLNGVARQSEDALGRSERINRQLSEWRLAVAGVSSKTPVLLVDLLAANPFLTVKTCARKLHIAFTTAQRAVDTLEKHHILTEVSQAKRDRVYCAKALLDVLKEPAKLTAS